MSTQLQNRPDPSEPTEEAKPAKTGLSVTQVVGGALAAMTTAALGSRLGVAGTVVGAAIASIVAALAGSVYTSSLRRTGHHVRTVWTGRTGRQQTPTTVDVVDPTPTVASTAPAPSPTEATAHWLLPETPVDAAPASTTTTTPRRRVSWKAVVAGSLATFAIAALALTGFELVSGQALSGGGGTTISQVSDGGVTAPVRDPAPSTSATPSPSASPSSSATTEPSAVPSVTTEPSATPTTAEPSVSPTATPTPSAATPTAGTGAGAGTGTGASTGADSESR